jgi:hypothetical protein
LNLVKTNEDFAAYLTESVDDFQHSLCKPAIIFNRKPPGASTAGFLREKKKAIADFWLPAVQQTLQYQ